MTAGKHLALFVAVVGLVVGGATAAPTLESDRRGYVPVSAPEFAPDTVLADEDPETGEVRMESDADGKTVLVDVAHDNDVSAADLRPLVTALVENGHEVRFHRGGSSLNESLRRADALVVVNPRRGYGSAEIDGVRRFVRGGGRLLLLGDPPPTRPAGGSLVDYRYDDVASSVGVAFDAGYLYSMDDNANNFKSVYASPSGDDPLTDGIDRVVLRDASPVATADGAAVLAVGESTRRSTTRQAGACPVAVRRGNVVAIGDSDFVAAENAYDADNEVLIGNVADFLVGGDAASGAPARP